MDVESPRAGATATTARGAVTRGDALEPDKKLGGQTMTNQYLEGLEARFIERCETGLGLDERASQQSLELFRECKPLLLANKDSIGTGSVEETERLWNACVMFCVKRLATGAHSTRLTNGTNATCRRSQDAVVGFTLSQILRVTKLSVVDFFKELPQFLTKSGPILTSIYGDGWEKRLQVKDVQANFVYLTVLYNYYKRVYGDFFESLDSSSKTTGPIPESAPIHMRFGWMLYLALRTQPNSTFADMVTCITGLLAIIIVMILHMPPALRKVSFENHPLFKGKGADGRVNIVKSLSTICDASEEDVFKMVAKASTMIGELLTKTSASISGANAEQLAGIETEGLPYFEGLMNDENLTNHLKILEAHYEEAFLSRGELDERIFINGDESVIGAIQRTCSGYENVIGAIPTSGTSSGLKRKYDLICSPTKAASVSSGPSPSSPSSPSSSPAKPATLPATCKMPPPTPVTVTMTTAKWLRTVIVPLPAHPSPELRIFFRSCDHDIFADVTHRTQVLLEGIFPSEGAGNWRDSQGISLMDSTWAEQRRSEATKLYYRVLGAMCRAESQRLHCNNLTSLLTNERFHRCMIACSAELVLATHKTLTMTFPAVLEPTGITAFDLSKVIESFVRHEETLPRELKRHLNFMEEQILETMAWEKGSSMYNSLIVARKNLASEINRLGLLAEPMPSLDNLHQQSRPTSDNAQHVQEDAVGESSGAPSSPQKLVSASPVKVKGAAPGSNGCVDQYASMISPVKERPSAFSAFTSPVKCRLQPPLQSAFASPQRPSPSGGGETCAETVITVFFQKVLKLAAVRIKDLCERLHQPNQIWEQVYRAMQYILHHQTSLFFNRHIDQLILCSIYGICKVSRVNVTFRDTVTQYRKQPQCKLYVFRNVFIDLPPLRREGKAGGQETGDIIKFYNEIFVPATKPYLVQVGSHVVTSAPSSNRCNDDHDGDDGQPPGSPKASSFPTLPDMSPKKVSATHNVYVSPLRSTKRDSLMSPHTRSLYACVGESTHAYQSPSKDLTAINNRLNNRRLGRLDFNEASLVSDSLVVGSLYPCSRTANQHSLLTCDSVLQSESASWISPSPPSFIKRTQLTDSSGLQLGFS